MSELDMLYEKMVNDSKEVTLENFYKLMDLIDQEPIVITGQSKHIYDNISTEDLIEKYGFVDYTDRIMNGKMLR